MCARPGFRSADHGERAGEGPFCTPDPRSRRQRPRPSSRGIPDGTAWTASPSPRTQPRSLNPCRPELTRLQPQGGPMRKPGLAAAAGAVKTPFGAGAREARVSASAAPWCPRPGRPRLTRKRSDSEPRNVPDRRPSGVSS